MKIKSLMHALVALFWSLGLFLVADAQTPPDLTILDNYQNPTSGATCTIDGNPNSGAAKKAGN